MIVRAVSLTKDYQELYKKGVKSKFSRDGRGCLTVHIRENNSENILREFSLVSLGTSLSKQGLNIGYRRKFPTKPSILISVGRFRQFNMYLLWNSCNLSSSWCERCLWGKEIYFCLWKWFLYQLLYSLLLWIYMILIRMNLCIWFPLLIDH